MPLLVILFIMMPKLMMHRLTNDVLQEATDLGDNCPNYFELKTIDKMKMKFWEYIVTDKIK